MKIAVFTYGLPRPGEKRGGIERVAHDLAQALGERGHEVTVWSFDPAPPGVAYTVAPLPLRGFATSWLGRRLTMGYLGNFLAALPRYGEAEVIIAHGDSLFLPLRRKPVVRVMHGSALGEALSARTPWRGLMQLGVFLQELLTAASTRLTVGVSENTRRYNPFVRTVVPLGVDERLFHADRTAKTPHPSILFVGTLTGRKRGQKLLEWFQAEIRPKLPTARLEMVCQPGPAAPGVTYHSGIEPVALADLYRRCWVYASPSTYEGFGLPYVEAMLSGTPVIATPNPGSLEVLGGGAGALAQDAEFAAALLALLQDPAARESLTRAGLERASQFTLSRMADKYERLLERATAGGCRRAKAPEAPSGRAEPDDQELDAG